MSPIRTLVVDDEPLARLKLKSLVESNTKLEWIGEASHGTQAVEKIDELRPDLVMLDIRMPGMSGLSVLEHINHQPTIIFTTAFEQYAVTAFELQAVDYLLKPFGRKRFEKAIDRLTAPANFDTQRAKNALQEGYIARLFVRTQGLMKAVSTDTITHIEAADDYAEIHTKTNIYLISVRMKLLEERLDPAQFVRIHRSRIVNLAFVSEIEPTENGRYEVRMENGLVLESSRAGSASLRRALRSSS